MSSTQLRRTFLTWRYRLGARLLRSQFGGSPDGGCVDPTCAYRFEMHDAIEAIREEGIDLAEHGGWLPEGIKALGRRGG